MRVTYESNNSGGHWWLSDDNWKALESAGWYVEWGKLYFCGSDSAWHKAPPGKPEPCIDPNKCPGHRKCETADEVTSTDRWLGALAEIAHKDFDSLADAIREFERITGMVASDNGCSCCGPPHSFCSDSDTFDCVSGEEIVQALYPNSPTSLREAIEQQHRGEREP